VLFAVSGNSFESFSPSFSQGITFKKEEGAQFYDTFFINSKKKGQIWVLVVLNKEKDLVFVSFNFFQQFCQT